MLFASRRTFRLGLRHVLSRTLILSGLLAGLHASPAMADELTDVSQLLRAGQHAQALSKADAFLSKNPKDAQMRFLKGVILTEQNKSSEAIVIFSKLTEDFPALPEPYNNLAVLYASSGQYDKARVALDKAIHTNPTYATAYENLGDVHAKLASQAYDKALQLDSSNSGAKSKLTMVRTLVGNTGVTNPKTIVAAAPVPSAPPAPAKQVAASSPTAPAPSAKVEAKIEAKPAAKEIAKQEAEAKAEARAAERKAELKQEEEARREAKLKANAAAEAERDQVLAAVNNWAKAWSSRDVKGYLNAYASDFELPGKQSRKDWAEERRARIEDKGRISVKIESPQVSVSGTTATVKFRQIYDSDRTKANSRKTLVMIKQSGKWHIKQERSGG